MEVRLRFMPRVVTSGPLIPDSLHLVSDIRHCRGFILCRES